MMDYLHADLAGGARPGRLGETVTPVAAPPDRRQGGRRVRHGRLAPGGGQRGRRRARAVRHPPHGHALHAGPGLGGGAGPGRAAGMSGSRAAALAEAGVPFVEATVVRAQRPTSVRPGDTALVLADGTIEGFVGGTCAEESVRRYSARVLAGGEPLLLRILPGEPDEADETGEEGAVTVANPCLSGGGLEVFLRPRLPAPRVLVVGSTPVSAALAALGPAPRLRGRDGRRRARVVGAGPRRRRRLARPGRVGRVDDRAAPRGPLRRPGGEQAAGCGRGRGPRRDRRGAGPSADPGGARPWSTRARGDRTRDPRGNRDGAAFLARRASTSRRSRRGRRSTPSAG